MNKKRMFGCLTLPLVFALFSSCSIGESKPEVIYYNYTFYDYDGNVYKQFRMESKTSFNETVLAPSDDSEAPLSRDFKGWDYDKDNLSDPFPSTVTRSLDFYPVFEYEISGKTALVLTGIDDPGHDLSFTGGATCLWCDWSKYTGGFGLALTIPSSIETAYFFGNQSHEFSDLSIVAEGGGDLTLNFSHFKMTTLTHGKHCLLSSRGSLTMSFIGEDNSFTCGTYDNAFSAVSSSGSILLSGDGATFTRKSDSDYGIGTGPGITCSSFSSSLATLNVYGSNGAHNNLDSDSFILKGYAAIETSKVALSNGKVYLKGGDGADGKGGVTGAYGADNLSNVINTLGAPPNDSTRGKKGGNGEKGGDGAPALYASTELSVSPNVSLTKVNGNGGAGGKGGDGGRGGMSSRNSFGSYGYYGGGDGGDGADGGNAPKGALPGKGGSIGSGGDPGIKNDFGNYLFASSFFYNEDDANPDNEYGAPGKSGNDGVEIEI